MKNYIIFMLIIQWKNIKLLKFKIISVIVTLVIIGLLLILISYIKPYTDSGLFEIPNDPNMVEKNNYSYFNRLFLLIRIFFDLDDFQYDSWPYLHDYIYKFFKIFNDVTFNDKYLAINILQNNRQLVYPVFDRLFQLKNVFKRLSGFPTENISGSNTELLFMEIEKLYRITMLEYPQLLKSRKNENDCKKTFKSIIQEDYQKVLYPYLFGKIYYKVKTETHRKVMDNLIYQFSLFSKVLKIIHLWNTELNLKFISKMKPDNPQFSNFVYVFQNCRSWYREENCDVFSYFMQSDNLVKYVLRVTSILKEIEETLNCAVLDKFIESSDFYSLSDGEVLAAIEFNDSPSNKILDYTILIPDSRTEKFYSRHYTADPLNYKERTDFNPLKDFLYWTNGFSQIQEAIDYAFMETILGKKINYTSHYSTIKPPCALAAFTTTYLRSYIPILIAMAWFNIYYCVILFIVYEKETSLTEYMKIMGLTYIFNWFNWFIFCILNMIVISIYLTIILLVFKVFENSLVNGFILIAVFISYSISLSSQMFLISTFFNKSNTATIFCGLIYLALQIPYFYLYSLGGNISAFTVYIFSLICQTNLAKILELFFRLENEELSIKSNLFNGIPWFNNHIQIVPLILMFYLDSLIYFLLTLYIERVFTGDNSAGEKWYFLCTKKFWRTKNTEIENYDDNNIENKRNSKNFEAVNPDWKVSVKIVDLVKYFSTSRTLAVDHLTLNFYKSQITSFLGKNGAGKSTTLSILTGFIQPTKGKFYINEFDGTFQMSQIRKIIGYCPQHNILWDFLTVFDHFKIFSYLKQYKITNEEIDKICEQTEILDKKFKNTSTLSGGMKRKLSLALAFLGNPEVIFLDEPTAGVDPESRFNIWQYILKEKRMYRSIILTTHHLDEADYLSDRVTIISNGHAECSGTSMFLKNIYGDGYYLYMTKSMLLSNKYYPGQGKLEESIKISEFIHKIAPNSILKEETKTNWVFVIPKSFTEMTTLLEKIDTNKNDLNIEAYGISDATLEDVFITSTETKIENKDPDKDIPIVYNCSTGHEIYLNQLNAMLLKRVYLLKHNATSLIYEIIIPLVISIVLILLMNINIDLFWWWNPAILINPWTMSFEPDSSLISILYSQNPTPIANYFTTIQGEGALRCISNSLLEYRCNYSERQSFPSSLNLNYIINNTICNCTMPISKVCRNINYMKFMPSYTILKNGDKIFNLTELAYGQLKYFYFLYYPQFFAKNYGNFIIGNKSNYGNAVQIIGNGSLFTRMDIFSNGNTTLFSELAKDIFEIGSNVNGETITILYNNKGIWSLPAYINVKNNWLLNFHLDNNDKSHNYGIYVREQRIRLSSKKTEAPLTDVLQKVIFEISLSIIINLAVSGIISSFVMHIIDERINGSKYLEQLSGRHVIIYWLGNFLFDLAKLVIASIFIIIILYIVKSSFLSTTYFFGFFILYLVNGLSKIFFTYVMSFLFSTPSTAYMVLFLIDIVISFFLNIIYIIIQYFYLIGQNPEFELRDFVNTMHDLYHILYLIPQFTFLNGLIKLSPKIRSILYWNDNDLFRFDILGQNLLFSILSGILSFILLIVIDLNILSMIFNLILKQIQKPPLEIYEQDEDIKLEKARISEQETSRNLALKSWEISKVYGICSKFVALKSLSFGVNRGECFGLLGKNGAGKTTFFKILTREIKQSGGEIYVDQLQLSTNEKAIIEKIGFCPQFEQLNEYLTVRETLLIYFMIRSVQNQVTLLEQVLEKMQLKEHENKLIRNLSGGNKRKVSSAVSMIGDPPLLLLDEPTAGMDAESRHFLWNRIRQLQDQKTKDGQPKSVIITSHNMAEIEVLCNRVLIMSEGKIIAIGTIQHLKERFSNDYHIRIGLGYIKSKDECQYEIEQKLKTILNDKNNGYEIVSDDNPQYLHFIINEKISLAKIFELFQKLKEAKILEEYSIQQNNLNDLFLKLVHKSGEKSEVTQ